MLNHSHHEEIPNRQEQEIARAYCLERELVRPKTDVRCAIKWLLCFEIGVIVLSSIIAAMLYLFGISLQFTTFILIFYAVSAALFLILLKKILILAIKLYQHYAPEEVRRRCVLMPTCSEYAILALKKYGVIIGLYKTYVRLTKRCKGSTYSIDYP